METNIFFAYSWHIDPGEEDRTVIRIYGLDAEGCNICLIVTDFTPYVYIELPAKYTWNQTRAQLVGDKIAQLLDRQQPLKKRLTFKTRLYGAHINPKTMEREQFPYLFCAFSHPDDIKALGSKLRRAIHIVGLGALRLKMHESDADPILQLTCCRKIPTAGWISFTGKLVKDDKVTLCDREYTVKWKTLCPHESDVIPRPLIMGFDIEVNSVNPAVFPRAEVPGDKIFQISCVLARPGDSTEDYDKYLLTLGDPDETTVGLDVIVYSYDTEAELLIGFTSFIREYNPNILVGYYILGFDIPYMIKRAKSLFCLQDFDKQGFHKFAHAPERIIKWSSSAFKNQEFEFLDAEGRLVVDLLPLVQRDYKLSNYKLKTISEYFIGQTKDPLSAKGIFKCYKVGMKTGKDGAYTKKAQKAMGIVGKYCVQDSALVVMLVDKLKTWVGLTEMAKTCNVPIFTLYTQGQQIKVFSQLYLYCMYEGIVVEKDGYEVSEGERYVGAKVFDPVPGRYKMVVPFDFASLYPTTIIAYNISYDTWIPPGIDVPDSECHVMEWEDHQACEHDPKVQRKIALSAYLEKERAKIKRIRDRRNSCLDRLQKKELMVDINNAVEALKPYTEERAELTKTISKFPMCAKRNYRFLREPKGVMPTVIQNLLDARKHTRKVDMVKCYKEIDRLKKDSDENGTDNGKLITVQESLIDVLNKRQLAYKVSANSMYGAMGVRRGYLPFMPGAMCTTYMGRVNIEKVAKEITESFGGELIYGDTDSAYVTFPHLKTSQETWDHALHVAMSVTQLFPKPMALEFEAELYAFFFILSKKRYMYRKCLRDGVVEDEIGKKGVLLARRDNSKFVRDVYEAAVSKIASDQDCYSVLTFVLDELNKMCSAVKPYTDFVITKAVGDCGGLVATPFVNEKGAQKAKVGDYTVPLLSSNAEERTAQMEKKGAKNKQEFYSLCLPAQVQLAERMRGRGQPVDPGTRLEYVVTQPERHTAKQYEKIECADYMAKHRKVIKIDYMYYLKALVNPLDQVLDVAFAKEKGFNPGFVMKQYKFRWKVRNKVLEELLQVFKPKLIFEDQ